MAWRPNENLIDGELDNRVPGKVTGWMRFFRRDQSPLRVVFDLAGDFHEDVRGGMLRFSNPSPSDRNADLDREGTYMDGFVEEQRGEVGDITAGRPLGRWTEELADRLMAQHELAWAERGLDSAERDRKRQEVAEAYRQRIAAGELYYPYVSYPYVEWYADNGRVVLELEPSHVEVLWAGPVKEKTPAELVADKKRRVQAFGTFMGRMVQELSVENRKRGGDGNVAGVVIG